MVSLSVVKVKAVLDLLDVDRIAMRRMFEDELFKIEECPLVRYLLPYLNDGPPCVCRV